MGLFTKEVGTIKRTLRVADGLSLIFSHALPVISRITEAAADRPWIAAVFPIDLEREEALLRDLRHCARDEARGLPAPITAREIHARLLLGLRAKPLRKLLWHETTVSRIFQATCEIQSDLARPLVVGDLADRDCMSSSAFLDHFKAVTGPSPLQNQKDLRQRSAGDPPLGEQRGGKCASAISTTGAGDAPLSAHAKFANIRLRPRLCLQPLQPGARPLQPGYLQGQPRPGSHRVARPLRGIGGSNSPL